MHYNHAVIVKTNNLYEIDDLIDFIEVILCLVVFNEHIRIS